LVDRNEITGIELRPGTAGASQLDPFLLSGCVFRGRKRTRQPAARIRPLSPEQDARVTGPSPWMFAAHFSGSLGVWDDLQRTVRLIRCRRRSLIIRTECRVACFGPTSMREARRHAAAAPPYEMDRATRGPGCGCFARWKSSRPTAALSPPIWRRMPSTWLANNRVTATVRRRSVVAPSWLVDSSPSHNLRVQEI
jgi:hypothetical protein